MSLALLLEAVRVVEENKNGSLPHDARAKRKENKRSNSYRSTHNQLEKNRRAHLKHLLDHLRATVPAKGEMKQTTLNLLQSARCYIKTL
ncbi:max dimerization protein 1-like isoform X2 [Corticium candelabrum]|uniref:max dimerization protein 1-like isoform X2 n=1 Tax=Corticium candelabrum TaxID=121492 RepID=UPI002E272816|nr:max dimerization protein 1-like isoform X2 [Corticium candelabrum]